MTLHDVRMKSVVVVVVGLPEMVMSSPEKMKVEMEMKMKMREWLMEFMVWLDFEGLREFEWVVWFLYRD